MAVAAPVVRVPEISSASTRPQLLAWFRHWDADGSGSLDMRELQFALVACFYRALGDADAETKEQIVGMFLAEADMNGDGSISKTEFLEQLVPFMKANLPGGLLSTPPAEFASMIRLRLLAVSGEAQHVELPSSATVSDLRQVARQRFGGLVNLFFSGHALQDDSVPLVSIRGLSNGATVQILPGALLASAPPMQQEVPRPSAPMEGQAGQGQTQRTIFHGFLAFIVFAILYTVFVDQKMR